MKSLSKVGQLRFDDISKYLSDYGVAIRGFTASDYFARGLRECVAKCKEGVALPTAQ